MKRIGIFGGAFNPPHNEHIQALSRAKQMLDLDGYIVIPSYYPPHKNGAEMVDFEHRVNMCKLAFPSEIVSTVERDNTQKSYAINTVRRLKIDYPSAELFYLIGGDSMADLFSWYMPEELLKEVSIVVYPREGRELDLEIAERKARSLGGNIINLPYIGQNISSSELRYLISLGVDVSEYIPQTVLDYVNETGFYRSELVEWLKGKLTKKTYDHSVRCAVWALELNRRIGLDPRLVFESAMLHDVEKNSDGIDGVPSDAIGSPVAHQFSGANTAERMGHSEEVVSAIKYHTTAKPDMSKLEMLIYCADMTEKSRDFEGVEELRNKLRADLKEGFLACLKRTDEYLMEKGREIYHLTKDACEYYLK